MTPEEKERIENLDTVVQSERIRIALDLLCMVKTRGDVEWAAAKEAYGAAWKLRDLVNHR